VESPGGVWTAAGEAVLTVENPGTAESALIDANSGNRLIVDVGGWWALDLLGTLGGDPIVLAGRLLDGSTTSGELAVVSIDFDARRVDWVSPIDPTLGRPVATFPSPDGTRLLVAGQDPETGVLKYTILSDQGLPMLDPAVLSAAEGSRPLGWFDDQTFLQLADTSTLLFVDGDTGIATGQTLPEILTQASNVVTVGDGRHVLANRGTNLIRVDLSGNDDEIRTLADHCLVGLIGNAGWTAVS